MSKDPRNIDPDDFFAETRMSFGDHIEDLRTHLWRATILSFSLILSGTIRPIARAMFGPIPNWGQISAIKTWRGSILSPPT